MQSDEKSVGTSTTQSLCGVALMLMIPDPTGFPSRNFCSIAKVKRKMRNQENGSKTERMQEIEGYKLNFRHFAD